MTVDIRPGRAQGVVSAPPSKSMAHRLLICAGLSDGVSHIRGVALSADIAATIDCLRALGAVCDVEGDTVTVRGADPRKAEPATALCCRESGSTLRFFIPLALLCGKEVTFTGTEKLLSRPLGIYENLCNTNGFYFYRKKAALQVRGGAFSGEFTLPGDISSQFITGLLLALPLCDGDSLIRILPPVESRSYIQLTLQALKSFGVTASWLDENTLSIPGNQRYCPKDLAVEGDWSGAAFFYGLNALGGDITVTGLDRESLQGDKACISHMQALCHGCPEIDISDCPDLGPILFAVAAAKHGAKFTGTRRLKIKESDRAEAMAQELSAFSIPVTVEENSVEIGAATLQAPCRPLNGHNDHRIVMSMAVLLTLTGGKIRGASAVRKSFPDFFEKLSALGIEVDRHESDN